MVPHQRINESRSMAKSTPTIPPVEKSQYRRKFVAVRSTETLSVEESIKWRTVALHECGPSKQPLSLQHSAMNNNQETNNDNQSRVIAIRPLKNSLESISKPQSQCPNNSTQEIRQDEHVALVKAIQTNLQTIAGQFDELFLCSTPPLNHSLTALQQEVHQLRLENNMLRGLAPQSVESELREKNAALQERVRVAERGVEEKATLIKQLQIEKSELESLLQCASRDLTREESRVIKLKQQMTAKESISNNEKEGVANEQAESPALDHLVYG